MRSSSRLWAALSKIIVGNPAGDITPCARGVNAGGSEKLDWRAGSGRLGVEMIRLSVNVNKIATLRNARGGNIPDVVEAARTCIAAGCHGITVHPRPDARHITFQDVLDLAAMLTVEFNIEGYPGAEFLDLVTRVRPTQVTLVPDPPGVLTSNAGWNLTSGADWLGDVLARLGKAR